eukprot:CAMPEP_0119546460 /NCGR_PEP_ID=MMETSP1352-20130426/875_1 /TAXON_ID=265584 /ORGANISM="Stauroneis constricta, Strain CCMP1120" /LENGTH=246 /DNA_ID=CAMNT_0007591169 /DNA_START=92 /DNA_END=832 /DNA_ORIENTATION=+
MAPNATTDFDFNSTTDFMIPTDEWDHVEFHPHSPITTATTLSSPDSNAMKPSLFIDDCMDTTATSEASTTASDASKKVLEQWQSDDDDDDVMMFHQSTSAAAAATHQDDEDDGDDDELDIMKVDEQIGSNLLDEDIFGGGASTTAPLSATTTTTTTPLDELIINDHDNEFFVTDDSDNNDNLPLAWKKLQESMKRSNETRSSLRMKTFQTQSYSRTQSVTGVLNSIETSSQQLVQTYLQHIHQSTI